MSASVRTCISLACSRRPGGCSKAQWSVAQASYSNLLWCWRLRIVATGYDEGIDDVAGCTCGRTPSDLLADVVFTPVMIWVLEQARQEQLVAMSLQWNRRAGLFLVQVEEAMRRFAAAAASMFHVWMTCGGRPRLLSLRASHVCSSGIDA